MKIEPLPRPPDFKHDEYFTAKQAYFIDQCGYVTTNYTVRRLSLCFVQSTLNTQRAKGSLQGRIAWIQCKRAPFSCRNTNRIIADSNSEFSKGNIQQKMDTMVNRMGESFMYARKKIHGDANFSFFLTVSEETTSLKESNEPILTPEQLLIIELTKFGQRMLGTMTASLSVGNRPTSVLDEVPEVKTLLISLMRSPNQYSLNDNKFVAFFIVF